MSKFKNVKSLKTWLHSHGIDYADWGTNNTKSLDNLWHELAEGEIMLFEHPPLRVVNVVQIIIRRGPYILLEGEQVFGDGQRRYRNQPPAEKLKPGENYQEGAYRCLHEELGIRAHHIKLLPDTHRQVKSYAQSASYPGLPSLYNLHLVEAEVDVLPNKDFWHENESFTEGDPVRRHHWVWQPADQVPLLSKNEED